MEHDPGRRDQRDIRDFDKLKIQKTGKAVFITGGSGGLGLASAKSLVSQGFAIGLMARNRERLEIAREELLLEEPDAFIEIYSGDVTNANSVKQAVDAFATNTGGLEAVVHAAGRMRGLGPVGLLDLEQWQEDVAATLVGAGNLVHAASPWLESNAAGGAVVAFVGPGHHQGLGFASGYAAAQAGLVRLMENLALERTWPRTAGPGPDGFVGYYAIFSAVTPTGMMNYVLSEDVGRKWLPRFTEMFGEGKEVEPAVPGALAAWLCQRKPAELSGRVVSGMLDPELTELRLAVLGEGEKGRLRLKF